MHVAIKTVQYRYRCSKFITLFSIKNQGERYKPPGTWCMQTCMVDTTGTGTPIPEMGFLECRRCYRWIHKRGNTGAIPPIPRTACKSPVPVPVPVGACMIRITMSVSAPRQARRRCR